MKGKIKSIFKEHFAGTFCQAQTSKTEWVQWYLRIFWENRKGIDFSSGLFPNSLTKYLLEYITEKIGLAFTDIAFRIHIKGNKLSKWIIWVFIKIAKKNSEYTFRWSGPFFIGASWTLVPFSIFSLQSITTCLLRQLSESKSYKKCITY